MNEPYKEKQNLKRIWIQRKGTVFGTIQNTGSLNNSVSAIRRFLTFGWVPMSIIYFLGPW